MKKSTILITFTMMLTSASMVRAAGIDFDGRTHNSLRSVNFAIANTEINQMIPAPVMAIAEPQGQNIDSMSGEELKRLNSRLDSSIKTAIDYCNKNRLDDLKNNFAELLAHGTIKDKYAFVNNNESKYVFQNKKSIGAAIREASSAGQQKGVNPICMNWETQKVCVSRETKEKVCTAATLTCVVVTVGGAPVCTSIAAVCAFVIVWVDECNNVPYCTQWYHDVY